MALGYRGWIDEQISLPATSHKAAWEASDAAIKAADPGGEAGTSEVVHAFYKGALGGVLGCMPSSTTSAIPSSPSR